MVGWAMLRTILLCLLLTAAAGVAEAGDPPADQPIYAAPAAWVKPIPAPTAPPPIDGSAVQTLLIDNQTHFGPDGDDHFIEVANKILTPQGLAPVGTISAVWDPDTEALTIHRLQIIRDGKIIDVLAGGQKFLVLRRENNLELAMLDGRLTATIEPEGLQVGDVVDFAFTIRRHDPVMAGHSAGYDKLAHPGLASRVYFGADWAAAKPIHWRLTDGLPKPEVATSAGDTRLSIDMKNIATPKTPTGAPARFQEMGSIEFSDFATWSDVSKLFWPLYQKASTLRPDSALQAEISKIAAASPDPKARAEAALRLVEDKTRYVFLGMNDGGLTPADADVTWSRRFGDCKGKAALLTAVLRGLGISADPVLVSSRSGDGMDQRLPTANWFDHLIVRAQLKGKTYWLDGTRSGDRDIDDLVVPPFHWALPITA